MRFPTTLIFPAITLVLVLSACGGDATTDAAADDAATVDSLPFASDDDAELLDIAEDDDDRFDEELYEDDEPAPDVTPDQPLSESEAAALLATSPAANASAETEPAEDAATVELGTATIDDTHVGMTGVTAQHLMRELTLAYGGQAEMIGDVVRDADGGAFTFALSAVTIGDADTNRVDVTFSYVNDPDEPAMIVGHRAESVTLTPFELDG